MKMECFGVSDMLECDLERNFKPAASENEPGIKSQALLSYLNR
jgi:hypothetical protein